MDHPCGGQISPWPARRLEVPNSLPLHFWVHPLEERQMRPQPSKEPRKNVHPAFLQKLVSEFLFDFSEGDFAGTFGIFFSDPPNKGSKKHLRSQKTFRYLWRFYSLLFRGFFVVFSWLFRGPLLSRKTVFGPFSLLFRGFFVAFSWLFRGPRFGQILRVLALEQSSEEVSEHFPGEIS